jgi:hypothetical protein
MKERLMRIKFWSTTVFWWLAGYFIAVILSPILPDFVSLLIPGITLLIGHYRDQKKVVPNNTVTIEEKNEQDGENKSTYSSEVREYLQIIKEIVINENNNNKLDNEITEKITNLCSKIDTLLPYIEEIGSAQTKHEIRVLVMKDLNSVINPFLKLSVENKLNNRRKLLDGLKDINQKLKKLSDSIEQQDVYELERKLALISQKYNAREIY